MTGLFLEDAYIHRITACMHLFTIYLFNLNIFFQHRTMDEVLITPDTKASNIFLLAQQCTIKQQAESIKS